MAVLGQTQVVWSVSALATRATIYLRASPDNQTTKISGSFCARVAGTVAS
jgi:hypothetical protein